VVAREALQRSFAPMRAACCSSPAAPKLYQERALHGG
jgi:hypothetical protein